MNSQIAGKQKSVPLPSRVNRDILSYLRFGIYSFGKQIFSLRLEAFPFYLLPSYASQRIKCKCNFFDKDQVAHFFLKL